MSYKLIITIVPHNCGELVTEVVTTKGGGGGTILMARGTASNGILGILGFGDTSKDITYNVVEDKIYNNVIIAIKEMSQKQRAHFGVMFSIDVNEFLKSGLENKKPYGGTSMANDNSYKIINVIVNKGYADDAMQAARNAGAGGGTILNARGTAKPDDEKFMGITIVPEKEILMILVPQEKAENIKNAICALPCFAEKGSGVIFDSNANDFTLLGKQK